jgi:hypothetical protein
MYGAGTTYDGSPIGGGVGYKNIITNANYRVSTLAQLLSALNNASPGEIIYVSDDANINMTSTSIDGTIIPSGVTLASGRGNGASLGALLYDNNQTYNGCNDSYPSRLLFIPENGSRITGLRIRGPNTILGKCENEYSESWGFYPSHPNVELDNNEISQFSFAAIGLYNMNDISTTPTHIHHNYIHHNFRTGLGYGIDVGGWPLTKGSTALIEANIFDWNRHDVSGTGNTVSYIARNNIVLGNGNGHAFDMHGNGNSDYVGGRAGTRIDIYNNTIQKIYDSIVGSWNYGKYHWAIDIRGKPSVGAFIHDNYLYYTLADESIIQEGATENFNVSNNCFKGITESGSPCSLEPSPQTITCAISGCPSSIIQGQTMFIQPSFSGGLAPYIIQTLRDGVPYDGIISAQNTNIGQIIIPIDSSWTVGDHLVSFRITDSSSPQASCTTAACTISVTSPVPVTTGILDISSSPLGAEITIDNQDQGKVTRSIIQNIPAGDHLLKLTLSGYQDYTTTFTISTDVTTTLNPTLTPVQATVANIAISGCSGSITLAPTPANIILNPGFETSDPTNAKKPASWFPYISNFAPIFTYPEAGRSPSLRSASIQYSSILEGLGLWTQSIGVDLTKSYKLSGYIKTSNIVVGNAYRNGAYIQIDWKDALGKGISTDIIVSINTGTHDWAYYERIVTPPANTAWGTIVLGLYGASGKVWFDDIAFTDATGSCSLSASCVDQYNTPIACDNLIWQSSNNSVASVGPSGIVTALSRGTTNITARTASGIVISNLIRIRVR